MSHYHEILPPGYVRLGHEGGPTWRALGSRILVPSDLASLLREIEEAAQEDLFDLSPEPPAEDLWEEIEAQATCFEPAPLFRQVFDPEEIAVAKKSLASEEKDVARRYAQHLTHAEQEAGRRKMPDIKIAELKSRLLALAEKMPNFQAVVEVLLSELALALSAPPDEFRVTPILLSGAPGIGKTRFAREVAAALDVHFESIALATTSAGFALSGMSRAWGNSRPGLIAELMSQGEDATPVVLLDEVDKVTDNYQSPVTPVLLELLEEESGKRFRDEALEIRMDTGGVIFMATANDLASIPPALMSRLRVVPVRPPTKEECLGIARGVSGQYEKYGLTFSDDTLAVLVGQATDLRDLQRMMRDAAGRALYEGRREVQVTQGDAKAVVVFKMGFV